MLTVSVGTGVMGCPGGEVDERGDGDTAGENAGGGDESDRLFDGLHDELRRRMGVAVKTKFTLPEIAGSSVPSRGPITIH